MSFALVALVGLAVIIVAAVFSRRTGIATPLILLVVGLGLGMIPPIRDMHLLLEPEVVLAGILPPLLYASSVRLPVQDLRRNLKMITWLSVVMVVGSALVVGFVVHAVFAWIPLPLAFALGAVVSPTDAVAATAIGKRLGLPPRLMSILEGESLVNDASALVLLRTAVLAAAGGFSLWSAIGSFAWAVVGAIAVGGLVGVATVAVRARVADPVIATAISLAVPFVAYFPAEELRASGVLAVVVAGLVTGHRGLRRLTAADRQTSATTWSTVQFLLENGVFLAMGIELPLLLEEVQASPDGRIGGALGAAALVFGVLVAVRAVGMLVPWLAGRARPRRIARQREHVAGFSQRLLSVTPSGDAEAARLERMRRRLLQSEADLAFAENEPVTGRGAVVLGGAGMRGVVTLAAAQTISSAFPQQPFLVLVAFFVAVGTLILFGTTLPVVIRRLDLSDASPQEKRADLTHLMRNLIDDVAERLGPLDQLTLDGDAIDPAVLEQFSLRWAPLLDRAERGIDAPVPPPSHHQQLFALQSLYLSTLRESLLEERSIGAYRTETYAEAQQFIDRMEPRALE